MGNLEILKAHENKKEVQDSWFEELLECQRYQRELSR